MGDNDDKLYLLMAGELALAIPTHAEAAAATMDSTGAHKAPAHARTSAAPQRVPRSASAGTATPQIPAAAVAAAAEAARAAAAAARAALASAAPLGTDVFTRETPWCAPGACRVDARTAPPPPSRCAGGPRQRSRYDSASSFDQILSVPPVPARCATRAGSRGGVSSSASCAVAACGSARCGEGSGMWGGGGGTSGDIMNSPPGSTGGSPPKSSPRPRRPPARMLTPPSDDFGGHGAVVTKLQRGATFGEMALLYRRRRTATVVAAWRSRVWSLARSAYLDLLVNVPIDGIDTISVLRRLPLFRTDGGAGQKRLFPASLDTRVYRVGCAMQSSSYSRGAVVLELRPWSNVLLLVRSGSARHGRTVVDEGAMVVTGRPLDVALLSVAAELTGQRVVHAAWGSEAPSIVAEEDCELLAISLQEFMLLLGASEELLADPRSIRQLLRDVPDLTMLSDEKLERLAAGATVRSLEAGTQLYVEGELADRVHVLVDGQLQSEGSELCRTMIGDIASAEMLGMRSVVHGEPCPASVVALTRCVTICFAAEQFREVTVSAASSPWASARSIREAAPHEDPASITRVIGVVGQGAYGPVQLCEHADGEMVCVKLMRRDAVTEDRQQMAVMTEVELLREVRHSFVVSLLGTVKTERHLGLVLEPLLGGDLFQHLATRPNGTTSSDAARFYSSCIISALGHLHARRIVFRDLKPENVMLKPDGYVKLIDFGYAKRLVERTYSVVGTLEYLAPEVIMQRGHRFGADWWCLGILIYEMVAGYTPFTRGGTLANEMEICKNITSPAFRIDFPPDLPTCVARPYSPPGPSHCLSCDRGASMSHRVRAHCGHAMTISKQH